MNLFYEMEMAEALEDAEIVDLFAGPGGWSQALAWLGHHDVGVEFDRWACATRRAAGWRTVEADVSHCDPHDYKRAKGLIGSPPCQAFSNAGNRTGLRHVDALLDSIEHERWGDRCAADPRVWLILELGRWCSIIRPEWVAFEQVPAVLPLWRAYAKVLERWGYKTWVGKLNAADYGVPQIRQRAILMASRVADVGRPEPTHAKGGADGLERWVTMAEGLGWGMTERPALTLAMGKDASGLGGSGARASMDEQRQSGAFVEYRRGGDRIHEGWSADDEPSQAVTHRVDRWQVGFPRRDDGRGAEPPEDGYRARDWRDADEPAQAITEKARSMVVRTGLNPDDERSVDEPAPTATSRTDQWSIDTRRHWGQHPDGGNQRFDAASSPALALTSKTGGQWVLNPGKTESQPNRREYSLDEPAPTLAFGHDAAAWTFERPATTIAGDSRAFAPGGHIANDGRDNSKMIGRSDNTIRLSIVDALRLQSFPADYPVRGVRTKQFEQIGNAVPPLLALAVVRRLLAR